MSQKDKTIFCSFPPFLSLSRRHHHHQYHHLLHRYHLNHHHYHLCVTDLAEDSENDRVRWMSRIRFVNDLVDFLRSTESKIYSNFQSSMRSTSFIGGGACKETKLFFFSFRSSWEFKLAHSASDTISLL